MFLKKLFNINWLQTLIFNFHYFSLPIALRLPVFVYRHTIFNAMQGTVELQGNIRTGMVRIGKPIIGAQDYRYDRTVLEVHGRMLISELVTLGRGSRISIGKKAELFLGKKVTINGNTSILCRKNISFGDGCLLSWDIIVMDTDWHNIECDGEIVNPDCAVQVGDHVWIGCRCIVLKGTIIPQNCVIAAGSIISSSNLPENNAVYGGQRKNVGTIRKSIKWKQ